MIIVACLTVFLSLERVHSKFSSSLESSYSDYNSPLEFLKYETSNCSKWICDTNQIVPANQCAVYKQNIDTVYVSKCIEGDYCTSNTTSHLYTCKPIPQELLYPMEKCSLSSQCNPNFSAGCEDGICSPGKSYPNCTQTSQCGAEEWCEDGESCQPLLEIGQFGCKRDADCVYNAGCHIVDHYDTYLNLCVAYGSIQPRERIKSESCDDNQSMLCSSGYCSQKEDGYYYCTDEIRSLHPTPTRCYNTQGFFLCNSEVDEFTGFYNEGSCQCGLNEDGYGYCELNYGDPLYLKYRKLLSEWLNSEDVKNCNTERRFALSCIENYWNKDDYTSLSYYTAYLNNYAALQGADKCVISAFYPQYYDAMRKNNFGRYLVISSLIFLYN